MSDKAYTVRQLDAVLALGAATDKQPEGVTPTAFAQHFWPGKTFARGNGPWGLGPDASGRHGGKMLTTLYRLGLAQFQEHGEGLYYTAKLTHKGQILRDQIREDAR